jgi:hypothetical protein
MYSNAVSCNMWFQTKESYMKVTVKELSAEIELKNRGIELEVRDPTGKFVGDLVVTKAGLVWCQGKTSRERGHKMSWKDFIRMAGAKPVAPVKKAVKKAAKKAVKKVTGEVAL